MLDQSVLEGLLAKVREAKGPDRELDAEIAKAFGWQLRMPHNVWAEPRTWTRLEAIEGLPPFSRSKDYAVALVEHELPGAGYEIIKFDDPKRGVQAEVGNASAEGLATAPTAPLAILTALLLALSQDETREETVDG